MIINTENKGLSEFAAKILVGLHKANRKMVENAAANNQSLIIGDDNGGFKEVPAKELLEKLRNENF